MRRVIPDVLLVAGLALMTYGVRSIYPPAGWVFLGGMLFLMGFLPAVTRRRG
jgi:hypothetical protein